MSDHIGVAGHAMYRGIPATTIAWGAHTLTVYKTLEKSPEANVKESGDNTGETVEMNRTNKRFKLKVQAKPIGATKADALAIAADLPQKMDILTVTAPSDSQIDSAGNTVICDSANASWSPEDELSVDIEATVWTGKVFVPFA
jgi:hypothetical protein